MIGKISFFFLLSCALCAGQAPATPSAPTNPSAPQSPNSTEDGSPVQSPETAPTLEHQRPGDRTPALPVIRKGQATKPKTAEGEKDETENQATTDEGVPQSDFEKLVADTTGQSLRVIARNLFRNVPSTFSPLSDIPVPADYAIGPGDEIIIRAWGKVDLDVNVTVNRNGQITIPKVGTMNVVGLRYDQLTEFLRTQIGTLYKGFELNVTLGRLRSIQIFVLGNARQPGQFTVSSLSTLLDALFASGGPSETGSMRHILLQRAGKLVTDLDLYDVLRNGDKSHDVQLLPGDVIVIPPVGPQVAIFGSVKVQGIYELKDDISVAAALRQASGLTNLASLDRVTLERIENRKARIVEDFPLDAEGLKRTLQDADVLKISPVSPKFDNAVTIRGNIASPGRFPWHEGMRISDLIPSRAALVTPAHWNIENHISDDRHTNMMEDIAATNAEIDWDYAAIERLDQHDLSTRLIPFNLANAIDSPSSSDNQILRIGDVVTIFSRKDIALPLEKHATFVQVGGEVNAPGVYRIKPGETLRDLVERAGGLTAHSYLFAAQLTRLTTQRIQQEQLDLSIAHLQRDLAAQAANAPQVPAYSAAGGVVATSSEDQSKLALQSNLVSQLSAARATGRVVLEIRPNAQTVQDIPAFQLEDGDSFYIPPMLDTIQVVGEVYNPNAFRYKPHKTLGAYLRNTGGATRMADVKRAFLIRADGTVVSRQSQYGGWSSRFESIKLMPGDAIVVPPKLKTPGRFLEDLPMITQIVSQTAMTGAVISLLR